jgi:hypothetical protein
MPFKTVNVFLTHMFQVPFRRQDILLTGFVERPGFAGRGGAAMKEMQIPVEIDGPVLYCFP